MSRKSILWIAVFCSLTIALVGLSGCRSKEPVIVTPPAPEANIPDAPEIPLVWPLTGLDADSTEEVLRRTLSVKIDNHPQSGSKVGINSADVVFETLAEGGITRFNAIYQSEVPDIVMPVRSARESDLVIVPQFGDALFFYSGANASVRGNIRSSSIANMEHGIIGNDLYRRSSDRRAPHNLMVELGKAYDVARDRGFDIATEEPIKGFGFQNEHNEDATAPTGGRGVTRVSVPFSPLANTAWTWDADSELWTRTQGGNAQYSDNDEQISANNVIVMWAQHSSAPHGTYSIDLAGSGDVSLFMDGQRFDGTWEGSADAPPVFKDAAGNEIFLTPGRIWISVMKPGDTIESTYDGTTNGDSNGDAE